MDKITSTDLQGMVSHWIATPPNGYLGSSYGADLRAMLLTPMKTGLADALLNKLRVDVPLVGALPSSALNMYAVDEGPDKRNIYIEASGLLVALGSN
jgi:hypothetical protein